MTPDDQRQQDYEDWLAMQAEVTAAKSGKSVKSTKTGKSVSKASAYTYASVGNSRERVSTRTVAVQQTFSSYEEGLARTRAFYDINGG